MAAPPSPPNRDASPALARIWTIASFVAAWIALSLGLRFGNAIGAWVEGAVFRIFSGYPSLANDANHVLRALRETGSLTYFVGLWMGTIAWSLGFLVRMIARARVRSGARDFLEPVRAWTQAHAKWTRALAAVPGAAWGASVFTTFIGYRWEIPTSLGVLAMLEGLAIAWWSHVSARALLAPTVLQASTARFEIRADEILFDAVALTTETRAAVAALAALTLATGLLLGSRPLESLYHGGTPFLVMFGYAGIAAASAVAFRLASRVAVGVDGVHVRGTSRAKFFAYRDIDEARANGSNLELVLRGRVVLRLQLHGEDAARRDAVLARITEHIARVKAGEGQAAAQLVASATKETLARVAGGGADYRMAALTREQLWRLVEGPEIDASTRKAAAEALAKSSDDGERARLRVAAEHCAEPQVRIALEEIARGEADERQTDQALGRRGAAT